MSAKDKRGQVHCVMVYTDLETGFWKESQELATVDTMESDLAPVENAVPSIADFHIEFHCHLNGH